MPRFTLLQLLASMTVSGVLFAIAAIDPVGSFMVLLIIIATAITALMLCGLTYLGTRIVSEITFMVFGQPAAASPFGTQTALPPASSPTIDLATAVDHLQAETERELGSQAIEISPDAEDLES